MIGWIIGIGVAYVLSVLWCRYETKMYLKKYFEPTIDDVIFTLIPVVNLFVIIDYLLISERWGNVGIRKKIAKKYFGK